MDKWIKYDGNNIYYRTEGTGPPVVFVHGFGEDGTVWDNQVNELKKYYSVIIPDIPGSGRSDMADTTWSMEKFAEVIRTVLEEENITKTTIVGHSMGGYISLAFAEKYSELLNGFALLHSTAFADSEEKKETRQKGIKFIKENGAYEFLKQAIPNLFSEDFKKKFPERIQQLITSGKNFSARSLVTYYKCMMQRPDRTGLLSKFKFPVQFVIGKDDKVVPIDESLKQSHLPAISHIHILEYSAHMGMWEEGQKTTRILSDFLNHLPENC